MYGCIYGVRNLDGYIVCWKLENSRDQWKAKSSERRYQSANIYVNSFNTSMNRIQEMEL